MQKTVLITGTSSGFGKLIAKKFQQEGWNVIATMRSPEKETELTQLDNVLVSRLDVTDNESISRAVAEGLGRFGRIDVLVNNAGFSLHGPLEATPEEKIRRQMDVNVFGLVNVTKALLPHLRSNKEGVIINFSSIGGRIGFPFNSMYHASKFAIEGLTESLQYELNPLGIKIKLIEPGVYNTQLIASSEWSTVDDDSDYKKTLDAIGPAYEAMSSSDQDPQEVADITFTAATDGTETLRYPIGADAEQMLTARSQMTDVEFKRMLTSALGL